MKVKKMELDKFGNVIQKGIRLNAQNKVDRRFKNKDLEKPKNIKIAVLIGEPEYEFICQLADREIRTLGSTLTMMIRRFKQQTET
jgi:hypothetical protein